MNRNFFLFFLITILSFSLPVLSTIPTVYVDSDGVGTGCPGYNFKNISAAVQNASLGYNVYICNGTYFENVVVDKKLSILGEGNVTIVGSGTEGALTLLASNVTVSKVTVTGGAMGISVMGNYSNVQASVKGISNDSEVLGLFIGGNHNYLNISIGNLTSTGNTACGVLTNGSSSDNVFNGLQIYNVSSYSTAIGIGLLGNRNNLSGVDIYGIQSSNSMAIGMILGGEAESKNISLKDVIVSNVYSDSSGAIGIMHLGDYSHIENVNVGYIEGYDEAAAGFALGGIKNELANLSVHDISGTQPFGLYLGGINNTIGTLNIADITGTDFAGGIIFTEGDLRSTFSGTVLINNLTSSSGDVMGIWGFSNYTSLTGNVYISNLSGGLKAIGAELSQYFVNISNLSIADVYAGDDTAMGLRVLGNKANVKASISNVASVSATAYGASIQSNNSTFRIAVSNVSSSTGFVYGIKLESDSKNVSLTATISDISAGASQQAFGIWIDSHTTASISNSSVSGIQSSISAYGIYVSNSSLTDISELSIYDIYSDDSGYSYGLFGYSNFTKLANADIFNVSSEQNSYGLLISENTNANLTNVRIYDVSAGYEACGLYSDSSRLSSNNLSVSNISSQRF